MNPPKIGDKIYIPLSVYISHGRDDIQGGLAEISAIDNSKTLPIEHMNYCFVGFKGIPENKKWNYKLLMKQQTELKKQFENQLASPDPDLHPSSNPPNYGW